MLRVEKRVQASPVNDGHVARLQVCDGVEDGVLPDVSHKGAVADAVHSCGGKEKCSGALAHCSQFDCRQCLTQPHCVETLVTGQLIFTDGGLRPCVCSSSATAAMKQGGIDMAELPKNNRAQDTNNSGGPHVHYLLCPGEAVSIA